MKFLLLCLLGLFLVSGQDTILPKKQQETSTAQPLPKPDYIPFQPGERLEFDLKYSFITAGHSYFEVRNELKPIAGAEHYHIFVEGKSNKFFDALYPVRDYYESFINKGTMLPSVFMRDISENKFKKKESYIFNQATNRVIMQDKMDTVPPRTFDILSAFYYVRCIDFSKKEPGTEYSFTTYFDREVFPVGVKYIGRSTISTGLGKFKVLVFRPKLIEGRIFKNQSDMTLYVSDDKNQIPIRIESAVYLDYVRADLSGFSNLKFPLESKISD